MGCVPQKHVVCHCHDKRKIGGWGPRYLAIYLGKEGLAGLVPRVAQNFEILEKLSSPGGSTIPKWIHPGRLLFQNFQILSHPTGARQSLFWYDNDKDSNIKGFIIYMGPVTYFL